MFAAAMMLAEAAPAAATAAAVPPAAAAPAKKVEDRLICRTESVTGSLMPKKTCRLASESARERQEQRQNLEKMQNNLALTSH